MEAKREGETKEDHESDWVFDYMMSALKVRCHSYCTV
jgi:hypothetical protein